ncbi:MAG: glucan biosynthesis protein G [Alsobacter sp.]
MATTRLAPAAAGGLPFDQGTVRALARDLSRRAYDPGDGRVPESLARLSYDQYRDIRFRPEKALLDGPFRLQLFHAGFLFTQPVAIAIVRDGVSTPLAYDPGLFELGQNRFADPLPKDLGFAGFRLHYPLNDPGVLDELVVFQGASYFRFLGRGQHYGLSTRGLALGSGHPGEEFPSFRRFWIEDPEPGARSVVIHALLDGPSVTGAYRFAVYPDVSTAVDVEATLFARRELSHLGLAPLTSMFWTSENDRRIRTDFRPEVHDSDGLLLHTGAGEWIWRPLRNPAGTRISTFVDDAPKGFGLMQRERNFEQYEDLEARYDLRPSYWVEPRGRWPAGAVTLVELEGPDETSDNIAAFWEVKEPIRAGSETNVGYTIRAMTDGADLHAGGQVAATFQTDPVPHGHRGEKPANARRFLVDFSGGDLAYAMKQPDAVKLVASVSSGRLTGQFLMPNPVRGGFRVGIDVAGEPGETIDVRAFLQSGERALTETWTFPWTVPAP